MQRWRYPGSLDKADAKRNRFTVEILAAISELRSGTRISMNPCSLCSARARDPMNWWSTKSGKNSVKVIWRRQGNDRAKRFGARELTMLGRPRKDLRFIVGRYITVGGPMVAGAPRSPSRARPTIFTGFRHQARAYRVFLNVVPDSPNSDWSGPAIVAFFLPNGRPVKANIALAASQ